MSEGGVHVNVIDMVNPMSIPGDKSKRTHKKC